MHRPRIALVSRDPDTRFRAARAFDEAPREWLIGLFESAPADADVVVLAPDAEGPGLELDLNHPERTIAAIEERVGNGVTSTFVIVRSATGGVGCTSIALHLAAFLSREEPALYVEATAACGGRYRLGLDVGGPDWARLQPGGSVDEVALPMAGGFRALLAPDAASEIPADVLQVCARHTRFVILDAGDVSMPFTAPETTPLSFVVLSPTIPSARRAAELLSAQERAVPISNRLGPGSETTDDMLQVILGRPIAVALPCSPALRDAEDRGRLLGRDASTWSRRVARLAARLSG